MTHRRELLSHVRGRHVRAATPMWDCELSPCAAGFAQLCAGPLPALAAAHDGTSDYRPVRRPSAAGE